jgi:hypothetical protein
MRTDVGGLYRRAPSTTSPSGFSWTPLLDWVGPSQSSLYSVNALSVGPQNGATLVALAGPYWAYSNCTALVSGDAGETWVVRNTSGWGLTCGGNERDRAVGDRLAAHPTQAGVLAVGGSDGRVYVTRDAFASGAPVRVALPSPAPAAGCRPAEDSSCVVINVGWAALPTGEVALLAGVPSRGLFASAGPYEDPTTWAFVAGSDAPKSLNRIVFRAGGDGARLWATAAAGGVWGGSLSRGAGGAWAVTWDAAAGALGGEGVPFSGIAVRGAAGSDVAVISMDTNSNTSVWRSEDGGRSWARLAFSVHSEVPWWGAYSLALNAACSLSWEESGGAAPPTLWATDFFGVYAAAAPPGAASLAFHNVEQGHEEVCMNVIRAPPVGPVLSGAADVGGWAHGSLAAYPNRTFAAADGWAHNCVFDIAPTRALAPSGATVDALWVTGGDEYGSCHGSPAWCGLHSWVGVSRDGGATFQDTNWDNVYAVDQANPYRVAVHPFNGARAVVAAREGLPLTFTADWGATWRNASGPGAVSVGLRGNFWFAQPLAVEKQLPPQSADFTLYFYNGTSTLFTSIDSGATFVPAYTAFPPWHTPFFGVATPPRGAAPSGDVWVFSGWKLYHSVNGGANFSQVWQFYELDHVFTLGPLPNVTSPAGRGTAELFGACVAAGAAAAAAAGAPTLPAPGAGAGYAVYAVGTHAYGEDAALYGSVDAGATWVRLAGGNATPGNALGDSPYVLEASEKDPGVLFVGTGGRGAWWRDVGADLRTALLECGGE